MADFIWMERRANATLTVTQLEASNTTTANATLALLAALVASESRSIRTSTIILTAFNIGAAFATAVSILYDTYLASCRNTRASFGISAIHPAEVYPLILSTGIVIQGLIFAAAQGFGLNSPFIDGCSTISQIVLPAIFIVPYIQVVFGLEIAIRSLRNTPFQARGKYDVIICLGVVGLMLIGTWIPTFLNPQSDHCFAQFAYYILRYGLEGLIAIGIAILLTILGAAVIFYRLATVSTIDLNQRIAASRMVYYSILGVLSWVFVIPWFVKLIIGDQTLLTSMMVTVVLNLSGFLNLVLQLFLRTNTAATSIKPPGAALSIQKHNIRIWGPNELALTNHMLQPLCRPRSLSSTNSRMSLVRSEKEPILSPANAFSPPLVRTRTRFNPLSATTCEPVNHPSYPRPVAVVTSPVRHKRTPSYSLFPAERSRSEPNQMSEVFLELPPPIHYIGESSRHRRDSSMVSSATVQIGLRLSHAIDADITVRSAPPPQPNAGYLEPSPFSPDHQSRMKTLPAVPSSEAAPIQLSPTVYGQASRKVASPKRQDLRVTDNADWI